MNLLLCFMFGNLVTANAYFVALSGSFNDVERNYSLTSGVLNVISCLRKCRSDDRCTGFVYNETDRVCGLDYGQNTTSNQTIGTAFQVKRRQTESCGQYQKLLSIDWDGRIIAGTFEYLKSKIEYGAKLQLVITKKYNITVSFGINSAFSNDKVVCAQSKVFVNSRGYYLSYLFCTNGRAHRVKISRNHEIRPITTNFTDYIKVDWFGFEDTCQQVILTDKSKPAIAVMHHNLFSMTVLQKHDTFVQMKYFTYTDMSNEGRIELIHTGEISTNFTGEDNIFDNNSSWVSSTFTFSERVDILLCPINDNISCVNNIDTREQTLYFNGNWEKVFTKLVSGITDVGALETLRILVLKGQKITVHFRDKFIEPDIIFVENNDITAIFSRYPIKSDSDQTYLLWDLVSTSGRYDSIIIDYLTGNILNITVGTGDCTWFVDKAIWTKLQGTEQHVKDAVEAAVTSGYPIRIQSNCLNDNENATTVSCLYDGNYIYI